MLSGSSPRGKEAGLGRGSSVAVGQSQEARGGWLFEVLSWGGGAKPQYPCVGMQAAPGMGRDLGRGGA